MSKLLLLLACLIVPGVWGLLVSWLFMHGWPGAWGKGPAEEATGESEPVPVDPTAPPAEVMDFQI
jgi:hypothetical protein